MATAPTAPRRTAKTAPHPTPPPPVGGGQGGGEYVALLAARECVRIPLSAFTLAGFRDWATSPEFPEHVRATFVDGEIILDMSNEDPEAHVSVKGEVFRVLANLNRELKLGMLYADGVLVSNEDA